MSNIIAFVKTYAMPKSIGEWIFVIFMTFVCIATVIFLIQGYLTVN